MLRFVLLKLRQIVPVMALVTFFTTLLAGLIPGSPVYAIYGEVTPKFAANWDKTHGLDDSVWVQWWHFIYQAFHGNLGSSWVTFGSQSVRFLLAQRVPVTAEIAIGAMIISFIISVPMAMGAAFKPTGRVDRAVTTVAVVVRGDVPASVSGVFFVFAFAVRNRWFPSQGWVSIGSSIGENIKDATLPTVVLVLVVTPILTRVLRGDLVSILNEDFVASARARGEPEWYIMTRHVLRPASASLITVAGISFGLLLGGSIIVELFFNLPGLGDLAYTSVINKDIPVLQGIVVMTALFFVVVNTMVDLLYGVLDPRVRLNG